MSTASSTPSSIISLPKGGGALQGIGEKFSPDQHTGTGNFTIPIALPPGRNGFQPQLNLVYSTGNGNGPFGLGWGLSIPGVSRLTSKGVPRYDDTRDIFVLSGAEDLVPVSGALNGAVRYRPRTEGLFARIEHRRDAENNDWEVHSKDGLVSVYGTPRASGSDPAVVADPSDRHKVFCWKLSETVDPFGNRIVYEYERDTSHGSQLYLKRIQYADDGETKFLVSVTFEYEDRPDPFSEHRAGFEIRTTKRCRRIAIRTHADAERLTRTYQFIYLDQRAGLEDRLPLNGVSLLSQFTLTGHDDDRTEALPPLEFGYTRFAPQERTFSPVEGADLPAHSLANPDLELADLFGNGLPDIFQMNGTVRYWRNLGAGRFALPREMRDAPAGVRLADPGVQMIDADGDGRIDLLVSTETMSGYFPLRFDGQWDRRSFQRYPVAPSFNLDDPEVRLVDLDGDGVTDAIRSGTRLECFFNDPQKGWTHTRRVERRALDDFPNVNFSDQRVKFADMTGDGLQAIVVVHDGSVEYWPSLGHGDWGTRITMRNNPRFPYGYDPKRILVGDVDGDGLADLVYVDDTKVTLWINQSGNRWSDPIEIKGTPPVSDMDAVRLVDLLGTGISGVLWSADATARSRRHLFFLDFSGSLKPYLLDEMNNHMGAVTRVAYAPSTQFYVEDETRPETRWKTPLPFPVQVVARVEVIDAISSGKLTTEYRYHHGYWDGAEREFRGFGMVEQLDSETFEDFNATGLHGTARVFANVADQQRFSPPTLTKTWFHQGPIGDEFGEWEEADYDGEYWPDDPQVFTRPQATADLLKALPRRARRDALRALRGSVLRTELYALDGTEQQDRPYTVTESLFGLREELPPNDEARVPIFFPHALAQRTTQWERGHEPMTQFAFTGDYDEYGQARSQIAIAVPRGRDFRAAGTPGGLYLATHTVTDYIHRDDAQRYLIGRMVRTTSYEILNDGSSSVFTLHAAILEGSAARRIIGQALNFYDGPAFIGLPFGQLGDHGVLARTESLVLTEEILHEAYKSDGAVQTPPEMPPYLIPGGAPAFTADYPQEFRELLPPLAGYTFQSGGAGSEQARGYWVTTERRHYDCQDHADGQGRGLLKATRDPLGRDTTISYDAFDLLPTEVIDPVGLTTKAVYDYRVMQPREVIDPNGNRAAATFTPLGLPAGTAVMGKAGEAVGDTVEVPGSRLVYDFFAFAERGQPLSARTIKRVHHVNETDIPLPERDEIIESVEYSDGFGRQLQTRTQAEDLTFGDPIFGDAGLPADQAVSVGDAVGQQRTTNAPSRVVVSGWQLYDNKGRVIEKFEPFFSTGFAYAPPNDAELGQRARMFYDPRGQVIRTVNPDGSEQRVIFGVPVGLTNPDRVTPTPWEAYTYDANDNAQRTHGHGDSTHWNTPANIVIDALGRAVTAIARNGTNPATDWFTTTSTYDIQGNLLTVTDALGRVAFTHLYDLAKRPLRIENMDAGIRRTVLDALGNLVERRDSKGALALHAYDVVHRPIRLWARDESHSSVTLRERLIYGDSPDSPLTPAQAVAANVLGKPYQHYDEVGLVTVESYDFKGNVLEKTRRVLSDAQMLSVFAPAAASNWQVSAFRVDWQPLTGATVQQQADRLLDQTAYRTTISYDGLNRVKAMRYPQDVDGARKALRPHYNHAGALERVDLDGTTFVEHLAYNAKGQRVLIAYGNGVMTRYAYEPQTFRLTRLRTERYSKPDTLTYHPTGAPVQDVAYQYDLTGNITAIHDRTPDSGIPNALLGTNALDRTFSYDPIYRLLSATGRETDRPPAADPWDATPRSTDMARARAYSERYHYDQEGNLTQLQHQATSSQFTRNLALVPNSNRLATVTIGQTEYDHAYDPNGNLVRETASRHFEWDQRDRMKVFRTQVSDAEPSLYAQYLYDAAGQRVKKLVRKQGGQVEITTYIDGIFEHHRKIQGNTAQENNTLHIMDDQSRIALVRVGLPFPDDTTPAVTFHLGDHLGSSHVVIDASGGFINREEYTPYGETSFGSFAQKRYRFTGKERDEESGLNYHSARYYSPWLARWISCDPAAMVDSLNLYVYVSNNPTILIDPNGEKEDLNGCSSTGERPFTITRDKGGNPIVFQGGEYLVNKAEVQIFNSISTGNLNYLSNLPDVPGWAMALTLMNMGKYARTDSSAMGMISQVASSGMPEPAPTAALGIPGGKSFISKSVQASQKPLASSEKKPAPPNTQVKGSTSGKPPAAGGPPTGGPPSGSGGPPSGSGRPNNPDGNVAISFRATLKLGGYDGIQTIPQSNWKLSGSDAYELFGSLRNQVMAAKPSQRVDTFLQLRSEMTNRTFVQGKTWQASVFDVEGMTLFKGAAGYGVLISESGETVLQGVTSIQGGTMTMKNLRNWMQLP